MDNFNKENLDFYLNKEKKVKSESYIYNYNSYDFIPEILDSNENHLDANQANTLDIHELSKIEEFYIKNSPVDELLIDESFDMDDATISSLEEYDNVDEYYFFTHEVDLYTPEYENLGVDEFIELICDLFDFGINEYYQLYSIFENKKSIHHKTKEVIFNFLTENCTVSEIELAYQIKQVWEHSSNFHYASNKYNVDVCFEKRSNISWKLSMSIVKCFNSLPSIDEIELLLYDLYNIWVDSYSKTYKFFYDFLSVYFDNKLFYLTVSPISLCEINKSFWEDYYE